MDYPDTQGDIFLVRLGNVPAKEKIVDITFVGELKQDAHMDGIRYTLSNSIAPRYDSIVGNRRPSMSFSEDACQNLKTQEVVAVKVISE